MSGPAAGRGGQLVSWRAQRVAHAVSELERSCHATDDVNLHTRRRRRDRGATLVEDRDPPAVAERGPGRRGKLLGEARRLQGTVRGQGDVNFVLSPAPAAGHLAEVIEDRAERASTLIASQLPVPDWHTVIGDPDQADAICDRLLHDAHRIELNGPSLRRTATFRVTRRQEGAPQSWKLLNSRRLEAVRVFGHYGVNLGLRRRGVAPVAQLA